MSAVSAIRSYGNMNFTQFTSINGNLFGPNLRHFPRWFGGLRGVRHNPKLQIILVLEIPWQIFQMMLATVQQQTKVDEIPFRSIEQQAIPRLFEDCLGSRNDPKHTEKYQQKKISVRQVRSI